MRTFRNLLAAVALLSSVPALAQQGVPYFPQTIPSGTFVGRLSSGPGPTEAISTTAMLNALFPGGSAAFNFNAASVVYQGSVNGTVTTRAQAAAGTWTLQWPSTVGANNNCLTETISGSVATANWEACARLAANNTFSGNNTHNGTDTFNALSNFTSTFQKSGVTQNFPGSGNLVGTSDSQTLTNKSIDASQLTGTIAVARLPAGINTNTLLTKTANYTIASTDCGKTISGSGGPWTLTLPSVSGFSSTCVVQVCNADANDNTHHALRLSGFPAPSLGRLWMQQCEEVAVNNGAWIATKLPGKFRPLFTPTLFVDTGGSDTNDGLVSSAAANALATPQKCFDIFKGEIELSTTANATQPTCSLTGGQTFNGGLSCTSMGTTSVYFLIGTGSNAIIRNTGGNIVVQQSDFCGYIIFDRITLDCTSAASHPCIGLFLHQQNGSDLSTSGFTNGVNFIGANAGDIGIDCDSQCKINTAGLLTFTGSFGNLVLMEQGSIININSGMTIAAAATVASAAFNANRQSAITFSGTFTVGAGATLGETFTLRTSSIACISSLTNAGAGTSGRKFSVLDNSVLKNSSATAILGTSAGVVTASGYAAGFAPDNAAGNTGVNGAGCT